MFHCLCTGEVLTQRPLDREVSAGYWLQLTVWTTFDTGRADADFCWVSYS